jgi:methylenetetrahydrofolate reductase (NADPH)
MPIQSYETFQGAVNFCKTRVPSWISSKLEEIKDNEPQLKAFGIELAVQMCGELISNDIEGFHFYTQNHEQSALKVIAQLNIAKLAPETPWLKPANCSAEWMCPINWIKRPKSCI